MEDMNTDSISPTHPSSSTSRNASSTHQANGKVRHGGGGTVGGDGKTRRGRKIVSAAEAEEFELEGLISGEDGEGDEDEEAEVDLRDGGRGGGGKVRGGLSMIVSFLGHVRRRWVAWLEVREGQRRKGEREEKGQKGKRKRGRGRRRFDGFPPSIPLTCPLPLPPSFSLLCKHYPHHYYYYSYSYSNCFHSIPNAHHTFVHACCL